MENKGYKKPIIMSILVIVFVLIISGLTYAVFNYTSNANDNTVKSGQVTMTYIEQSNSYVLDKALPKHDAEGMNDPNYFEFTVTSSAKTNATDSLGIQIPYEINISSKAIEEGKQPLPEENIKVYLTRVEDGQEVAVTAPTKISELGNSLYRENATKIAYKLNLHKNGNETISTTYRLRAWIDFDTDASTWDGTITYQYKFTVNINSDTKYVGYTTDPACFTYEDDGNGGKKITGFSSTCNATNIIVPNTYTSKTVIPGETKQILNSYTANEEEWIKIWKNGLLEEGQTYEDYLTANNLTDEQVITDAKEGLKEITTELDPYVGKDITGTQSAAEVMYNILQDPNNEGYAIYSKIFTMNVETKTIPEHTEYKDYKVTEIATTDFQNRNIKTVILPDNIKLTNSDTFKNNKLDLLVDTNGHLPDACLVMDGTVLTAFKCKGIENLDLSDKNITEIYDWYDDLSEYGVFIASGIKTFVLPKSIKSIGDASFALNNIAEVNLSIYPNLTRIGKSAFSNNKISSAKFPDSLTTIELNAFINNKLKSIDLSNTKLTKLGVPYHGMEGFITDEAFGYNQITNFKLPSTLTSIGEKVFSNNKLTEIDLSSYTNLTSVGGFYNNQITSIKLPSSVTTLEIEAFSDNRLTTIDLSNTKVTTINNYAFKNNKLSSIKLPDTLTTIKDEAFAYNNLKTIKLPSTVTSIEKSSFFKREQSGTTIPSNPNLESIIYPGTTALTWDYAIGGLSSGVNPTAKNLPPYTYNGVSITAS